MTYGFDDVTFTSIGAAVAETQLNAGASLRVPSSARGIVEIIPYQMELGAFTTLQSLMTAFRVQSDDVAVEPKRFVLPGINGGDGAFTTVSAPALKAYPMNVTLQGFERINYFGQAQVANTVAPGVGATVVYSESTVGTEMFYQKPDNETAGSIAIDIRTAGNTITVTGGGFINALYVLVTDAGRIASEHDVGFMEFQSSDFQTSMPYRVAIQPSATGLGATASSQSGGDGIMEYTLPPGQEIPLNSNVTINTFYTNRDAVAVGSNFIGCVRYHR